MDYIENNNRMIALLFEVSTIRLLLALVCQQQQHRPSGASFAFRLTLSCPTTYHGALDYSTTSPGPVQPPIKVCPSNSRGVLTADALLAPLLLLIQHPILPKHSILYQLTKYTKWKYDTCKYSWFDPLLSKKPT